MEVTRWECNVCMYVYDPASGESESGVAAGTSFQELPEGWVCPRCGNEKENFEPLT